MTRRSFFQLDFVIVKTPVALPLFSVLLFSGVSLWLILLPLYMFLVSLKVNALIKISCLFRVHSCLFLHDFSRQWLCILAMQPGCFLHCHIPYCIDLHSTFLFFVFTHVHELYWRHMTRVTFYSIFLLRVYHVIFLSVTLYVVKTVSS